MEKTILTIATLLLLLSLPFLIWVFQKEETLDVAIVNKTAPDESYREHHSLTWLLKHNQYVKSDGNRYDSAQDYYGFMPNEEEESHEIQPFPNSYSLDVVECT